MSGSGLLCAVVAGLAVAYAVEEARRLRRRRLFPHVSRGQAVRRVLGSLLVALLMVLVFVGFEIIDPFKTPRRFILDWSVAGLLAVLLFALAILDLRELRLNEERARSRNLDRFFSDTMRGFEDEGRRGRGLPGGGAKGD